MTFAKATRLHQQGRLDEAISLYREAARRDPGHIGAANLLGVALVQAGRLEEAAAALRRALKIDPRQAGTHYNLGTVLQAQQRHEEAAEHFRQAIALNPGDAPSHHNLGVVLKGLGRYEDAVASYRKAIALQPAAAETHINLASALFSLERYEEAVAPSERGLELNPRLPEAHLGFIRVLQALHRHEDVIRQIDRLLEIKPGQQPIVYDRALSLLALERFAEGWPLYESRFSEEMGYVVRRPHTAPRWNGADIPGTLAVWGEQGLGDQILYASMLPDALAHAGAVVAEVEARLVGLFGRSFPGIRFRSLQEDPDAIGADAHIPMGGLGELYRCGREDFPRRAYLTADRDRAARLREILRADGKTVVGVSWRSANPKLGTHKTAPLRDFAALFMRPDVQLVDLQYGDTATELDDIRQEFGIAIRHLDEIDNTNDIDGLAALIDACDAVLTVSNTTAHLAGALGKPVWAMVPYGQGRFWYWFRGRADSLWYPLVRVCPQQNGQTWAEVIAGAASQLADFVQAAKALR